MVQPLNVTFRRPFYGVLSPGANAAVQVVPPIGADERLFCVASRPNEVQFAAARPDTVVITNRSRYPVAWAFAVIPSNVVGPSDSLWQLIGDKIRIAIQRLRGAPAAT